MMKRVIGEVGPYAILTRARRSPFESLVRAIAYQQLHEKAAESILKRFMALFPGSFGQGDSRGGVFPRQDCCATGSGGQGA